MNDPNCSTVVCHARLEEGRRGHLQQLKMACLLEAGQCTTSATVLPPKDMRYVPGKSGLRCS